MSETIRHIGFPVSDLKRSIEFYEGLGFRCITYSFEHWGNKTLKIVKMQRGEEPTLIELIQGGWFPHVSLDIDTIEPWADQVEMSKGKTYFIKDLDGNRIELVERRKRDHNHSRNRHQS